MKYIKAILLITILFSVTEGSRLDAATQEPKQVIQVEDVLRLALDKSDILQSIDKNIEAIRAEIKSRDLELSPVFSSELSQSKNTKDTTSPAPTRDRKTVDIKIEKPFATGTTAKVAAGHELEESTTLGRNNIVDWDLRLSQSLWRNSFGRNTRMRQRGDQAELQSRILNAEYQRQLFLVTLENVYWDLVFTQKEREIRQENLKRGESLLRWIRDRVRRSAAESTDLLQVEALVSDRRLQLLTAENRILETTNSLKNQLPGVAIEKYAVDERSLENDRLIDDMLLAYPRSAGRSTSTPTRLDALATHWSAEKSKYDSERIEDSQSPLLDFYISHGRNGINSQFRESWDRATGPDYTETQVGLLFSVDLDSSLKKERRRSGHLQAESQRLLAESMQRHSLTDWSELVRYLENLKQQKQEALQLAQLQSRKSAEERKRYQMGRTTAFQAIAFEVEAAEAQLRKYRLMADIRKLEARARLFTTQGVSR